jgi:serine/threonine-protein kinase
MDLSGDYRIGDKIAEGGMATVYKGEQISLRRPVAIKILSYSLTDNPEIVRRFEEESLIIARLRHPNIIHVIDRGITHGMPYFIMEFVEGHDLSSLIDRRDAPLVQKLDVAVQICRALAHAHRNGIIHRDIKPGNVLIDKDGQVYVTDFGIAELFGTGVAAKKNQAILGTPGYMAPEQAAGGDITAASDIYALGVMLYELFTGGRPDTVLRRPSDIDKRVPRELDEVILRCLHREARARYPSAEQPRERLLEILGGGHLQATQRARVQQDNTGFTQKNVLLDVLRDNRQRSVCLYDNKASGRLIVTKRIRGRKEGLAEARLLAAHPHPNIAAIHGASSNDRAFIIVMEYLAGGSLRERMVRSMPWSKALPVIRDVCVALAHALRHEVVHGNLRPSNILFTASNDVKVTDFGLHEHDISVANSRYQPAAGTRTREADLYALGVILHEMLFGTAPTLRNGVFVPSAEFAGLPADVRRFVTRLQSSDSADRFANPQEAIRAIDRILGDTRKTGGDRPPAARRTALWLAIAAVAAILLTVALTYGMHR